MTGFIQSLDNALLEWIQNNLRCNFLDVIMPLITRLGDNGLIWIIIAVIFIVLKKYRTDGVTMLLALVLCVLIGNLGLKPLVARARPFAPNPDITLLIPRPADFSFPSGHTMSSFAAATVIFCKDRRMGIWAGLLAVVIAFSRLYLYVHYPSDVLGGAIIGIILGLVAMSICNAIITKRGKQHA